MSLSIQKTQRTSNMANENQLMSPKGWVSTGYQKGTSKRDDSEKQNLPLAAARAEQLIDALKEELSIAVPVSYMRIETGTLYHILLLITKFDFLSPKIQAARILAEKYSKTDGAYDIRFSFGIESELMNSLKNNEYKLKHVRQYEDMDDEQLSSL
jgi:hypothetical protein